MCINLIILRNDFFSLHNLYFQSFSCLLLLSFEVPSSCGWHILSSCCPVNHWPVKSLDLEVACPCERGQVVWQLPLPPSLCRTVESFCISLGNNVDWRMIAPVSFLKGCFTQNSECYMASPYPLWFQAMQVVLVLCSEFFRDAPLLLPKYKEWNMSETMSWNDSHFSITCTEVGKWQLHHPGFVLPSCLLPKCV